MRLWRAGALAAVAAVLLAGVSACAVPGGPGTDPAGVVAAVGAENQYADVIGQVGGKYVKVTAIISNPNTDPHSFEASASIAQRLAGAQLVVQNGLGYDGFLDNILAAVPSQSRKLINVQHLLGLPDSTPNPHLWYKPGTMAAVADAVAADLAALQPAHAGYFRANAAAFTRSLTAWTDALAAFKARYGGVKVATTEPVADYLLAAAGAVNLTPWSFQLDVMNGTDPSPQDVSIMRALFTGKKVKALVYNEQVTDPLTESFIGLARQNGIPVVGVYETMPVPGYDYQSWMQAELAALTRAVATDTSTEHL